MYPFKIAFDWTEEDLKELNTLGTVNKLDSSDNAYYFIENIDLGSGITTVVIHGVNKGEGIGYSICKNGKFIIERIPVENLAEELVETGKWNGFDEVVLLACEAGTKTILSPAQELADQLQSLVWAPLGVVYFLKDGRFFIGDENITTVTEDILSYEYQRKLWRDFLPIPY